MSCSHSWKQTEGRKEGEGEGKTAYIRDRTRPRDENEAFLSTCGERGMPGLVRGHNPLGSALLSRGYLPCVCLCFLFF